MESSLFVVSAMVASLLIWKIIDYKNDFFKFNYKIATSFPLLMMIVFFGVLIGIIHQPKKQLNSYLHQYNQYPYISCIVESAPVEKAKSYQVEASLHSLLNKDSCKYVNGKTILYLGKDGIQQLPQPGDVLLIKNKLNTLTHHGNPGSFDYADFCAKKQIFHTSYLKSTEWVFSMDRMKSWKHFFIKSSQYFQQIIKTHIKDEKANAIAQALILGYREDIDADTYQSFAGTGIIHLIAISGLHVGILYVGFMYVLSMIPYVKQRKKTSTLLGILFIWLFSALTAFPPSVMRAATMFSFMAGSVFVNRKISVYNNLAGSAFLLLCNDPNLLYQVGFQLSYLAVTSIVIFYKPLSRLMYINHFLPRKIYELACVSLSAQILTFPLSIYYFHQFPVWFILSNLIAVPIATVILYLLILLLVCSPFSFLATWIGFLAEVFIKFLYKIADSIYHLPGSLVKNISIDKLDTLLIYLIIITIAIWLLMKKSKFLLYALSISCVLMCYNIYVLFIQLKQQRLIVYHHNKYLLLDVVNGQKRFTYTPYPIDSLDRISLEQYILTPANLFFGMKHFDSSFIQLNRHAALDVIEFQSTKIGILHHTNWTTSDKIDLDLLILYGKNNYNIDRIEKLIQYKQLIAAANIPFWIQDKISSAVEHSYSIHKQGAFLLDL
jgi:ComEC/Rec2-related protein